jgi:glycosyltransferase involved in cell wall biosynthesis
MIFQPYTPRVSMILCTYNNEKFIVQSIESILEQTYDLMELIVVDDGSTEDIKRILEPYMDKIRYIYQENQGLAVARNTGLKHAQGEYVSVFDDDDYLIDRDKTKAQVQLLDDHPEWGIVMAGWQRIKYDGTLLSNIKPWNLVPKLTLEEMIHRLPIILPSCLIRKKWLDKVGGYDPKYARNEDVDLLMRMIGAGCQLGWHRSPVFAYRIRPLHRESYKVDILNTSTFIQVWEDLFKNEHFPQYILEQENQFLYYKYQWAAYVMARFGQYDEMQHYLWEMDKRFKASSVSKLSAFDWLSFICYQNVLYGNEFVDRQSLISYLLTMAMFANVTPENIETETYIRWWLDVWWIYHRTITTTVDEVFIVDARQHIGLYLADYEQYDLYDLAIKTLENTSSVSGVLNTFTEDALAYIQTKAQYEPSLVSIVIPTHNCATYLPKALDSALEQTYTNVEIIVIDDGSTDNTVEILEPYQQFIQYVYQDNQGSSVARNKGIDLAKGEFVTFLDSDDYYVNKDKLHLEIEMLQNNLDLGAVQSGWELITKDENHIANVEPWHELPQYDLEQCFYTLSVTGIMMVRTTWLRLVGVFNPDYVRSQDLDLIMRLLLAGCQFQWLEVVTFAYRQRSQSSIRNVLKMSSANYTLKIWHKLLDHPNVPESIKQNKKRILFYKYAYVTFELIYLDYIDDATSFFKQMQTHMPHYDQAFYMVDFFAYVGEHLADGQFPIDDPVAQLLKILPENLYWNLRLSVTLKQFLKFWLNVWWVYYVAQVQNVSVDSLRIGRRQECIKNALMPYQQIPTQEFIKILLTVVLNDPRLIDKSLIDNITAFWDDMLSCGLVDKKYKSDIVVVYLTLLLRSLRFRHVQADNYLLKKIWQVSLNPRAIISWGRFIKLCWDYVTYHRRR